ncbi:Midasin [Manis pentadactyla]|nr:Midasin [Manis pentadactyla]
MLSRGSRFPWGLVGGISGSGVPSAKQEALVAARNGEPAIMEHLFLEVVAPLRLIAAKNEKSRSELGRLLAKQVWTPQDRQCILGALAQLLLDKDYTVLVGRQLRPVLLDLLERNAEAIKAGGQINHDLHERLCVAMSKLIDNHPDILPFSLRYFKDTSPVFQRLFLESSDATSVRFGRRRMKLRDLMEAAYKFLQQEQSVFRELWDWSVCVPLLRSHDTLVRWYTANCLALVTCMSEEHKLSFLKKIFSTEELIHFRLRLLEEAQLQDLEKALVLANPEASLWRKEKELRYLQGHLVSSDLSSRVTAVCGVVLPGLGEQAGNGTSPREQELAHRSFVLVESVCKNLQTLAMAVASQNAVLLEGPIGCGKTSLVEYLAGMTGRRKPPQFFKVQLGDQTDSKMLLGMYRCTDVPGEFVWQPGTLTQAATKGHWILLEDIDYAPLDVVSVLIPLLENGELLIPGQGDCLKVAPGFQFFATRRLLSCGGNWYRPLNSHATLLDKYWTKIHLDNLDKTELNEAEFFCQLYKPEIVINELDVRVGRVQLLRKQSEAVHVQREKLTFAATRPSSVLLEQLAVCVSKGETVLLVGETGTGKTSAVQYLAHITGHRLRVVNMNQQSDTADLLGGYKPVDHKLIWLPLREAFEELFAQTFSKKQNFTFLGHIQTCYRQKRWHDLLRLMQHVYKSAVNKDGKESEAGLVLNKKWEAFGLRLSHAQQQMKKTENALLFAFVEEVGILRWCLGTLAQAVKKGEWILLDEINLAAPETLECLSGLLEGSSGSLVLLDRGDTEPLVRHPDFHLFACMNPATDVGKRNLPPGIRNSLVAIGRTSHKDITVFTELYVEELESKEDLQILMVDYLKGLSVNKSVVQGIIKASHPIVQKLICQHIVSGNVKSLLKQPIPEPKGGRLIQVEGYWISVGDKEPTIDEAYILTSSVKLNLRDIVRVVSAGTYPVLIQGETSVGKTSLIWWLAAATGNHCVRINNHEHTDIQEYIGCYTSDSSGKLVFKEGVLIDAMRKGYWIILDELNLAPTDVLEALNRLLDDNRELLITETQEVVKAHPRFMLFATQNPPGLYGGRKVLSRAFRNRFVELHFDELPSSELETILHKRCSLPPSYCSKLVKVMVDLQSYRRSSSVFAGKQGFITLRDLFRWAERYRLAEQTEKEYDWLQHLANDGFMLLAGRVRKQEEVNVIQEVLEKHFKKKLCPQSLFSKENVLKLLGKLSSQISTLESKFKHIVWTKDMQRLVMLVGRALEFREPVLLVGDTGCGKTTICQVFADLANQKLYSINCHLHMETSDFLGGLRPVRQKTKDKEEMDTSRLFEWHDGPLVLAMKEDGFFLLDEISLADDSVLERLNSVLEVEKSLVLAEKGSLEDKDNEVELLTAGKKFRILATMNPGGDFGKKELSPALRNRFTEIWCPQSTSREDLIQIISRNLRPGLSLGRIDHKGADIAAVMLDFIDWLTHQEFGRRCVVSIRDILSWVNFMNTMGEDAALKRPETISTVTSFVHAACLVYIDGIGSGPVLHRNNIADYALSAGTTAMNAQRLLRATKLNKPILLEGSPGVGKTSLVGALARASGNILVRINLSEQTDITDLFGADLPVEGGKGGEFAWRDGPLLAALKAGHWVVLDEVFVDPLTVIDMEFIASTLFPAIDKNIVKKMVAFNNQIDHEVTVEKKWGQKGGPWEFNLRDLFRWCQLMLVDQSPGCYDPGQHVFLVYGERMRTRKDKETVIAVFKDVFGSNSNPYLGTRLFRITPYDVQLGYSVLSRGSYVPPRRPLSLLHQSLHSLESIMKCVQMSWMVILVGPASVGKTSLVQLLAHLTGHTLKIMAMNSAMDTTELLGGFEQVDLTRLWRQLLEKVEGTVRALLRDSLLTGADDAEVVLRAWSHFLLTCKPRCLGEHGKGVTMEIVNKLEAVLLLMQRLNNKINSYSKAEFSKLLEEFRSFGLKLLQSASGRSRGTFEWVDSMLVQALKSGDWLLMDNVNFCNPSVLDRLNALLEPGGVLTVSERGLIDGSTPTITPNPNFRLFLSMDPVHGEISRAMRNRGLEIYISGEGDGVIPDDLDLKVLLHSLGLVGDSVCDTLLALHTETRSAVVGSPASSISTLIQTALLIVQYLQRGLSLDRAFSEACWEAYVRSQHSPANQKPIPMNFRIQPLTLPDLEKIMQSSNPESLKFSSVKVDTYWIDEPDVLAMAVKLLIERATNQDWMLRVKWLYHLAKNTPQGLDEFVIPLDPRWNMQALDIIRNSMDFDPQTDQPEELFALLESVANKAIIYLDREKRIFTEANLVSVGGKKLRNSVLRMSFEFHKDPESYHSLPHEIVVNLAAFFELCDALILLWVQSFQGMVSDASANEILHSMHWRDRFWTVADTVKVDAPGLALLALHWHWVLKHLICQIPQLLMSHEDKYYKEVQTVSEHIQNCLGSPTGGFTGIKKLQKFLGRPFPFKDKLVVECFSQMKVLNKALAIKDRMPALGESGWWEDISRLQMVAFEWTLKNSLLKAWGLVLRANILEDINPDELKNLVNAQCLQLRAKGISLGFLEKKHSEASCLSQPDHTSLVQLTRNVQLWPAMEYLAMLWRYRVTADFMTQACLRKSSKSQQHQIDKEMISQYITFCLKHTPVAPQELQDLRFLLNHQKVSTEEINSLWSNLFNSTFTSFWSSTVTTSPEYWLTWSPLPAVQQREMPKSLLDSTLKGPGSLSRAIFSKCCFDVLTSSCRVRPWDVSGLCMLSSLHVTLGEWVERAQQLRDITSVLWTNMAVSAVAEFRRTDSQLQGLVLCRHLAGLAELLPESRRQEYMQNCKRLLLRDSQAFQHVGQTLADMAGQEVLPEELLCLLLTSLRHLFGEREGKRDLPEPAQRGSLWVSLGLLQIQTWLPQARFDPAVKREYKLKYAKEELHQLQCEWKTRNLMSQLQTGRDLEDEVFISYSHPHIRLLHQRIVQLENLICSLSKKQAFRPQVPVYESLVQEIHHYVTSIAKAPAVQDLLTRLLQALHMDRPRSSQVAQNLLKEEASWQQSHHQFRKRLAEEYALYPDSVAPLQASILQLQHGMRLVASEVHGSLHSSVLSADRLGTLVASLLAFPSVGPTFPTYYAHADALCSVKSEEILRGLRKLLLKCSGGKELDGKGQSACPTREQLLLNALLYLRSHVLAKGELDQRALQLFRHVCQEIINEWDEQQRIAQEKAERESSLYRYSSRNPRTALSEEEEEEWEFRKLFPLHEKDFADILVEPTLEEKPAPDGQEEEAAPDPAVLSQSSMQAVMLIHQQLCLSFARSLWYQQTSPSHEPKHYLSLFLSCYQTGSALVTHFYPLLGVELDDQLLGSQLVACTLSHNTLFGEATSVLTVKPDGPYDFYQHPNVPEAWHCQPVLQGFSEAVGQLLQDWPEHPVLEQLLVVMDRIRSFPLSSPISKFLNGLEILLAKAQDWEENASRALSLRKHLNLVSQMIIRWRKLELNCWSMSLDNTMKRHTEKSTKHWFSVYQMLEKHVQEQTEEQEDDKQMTLMLLVSTLQAFIEGSSLGEFHVRLQMLLVFHCHVLLMPQVEGKDSLCSVLWNLYHYYKQFFDQVQAKIVELRSPLEKELKEFVKISKWNDVSFWSIKQSVEKTHRTLFKFMKKFEAVLSEPCRSCLMESDKEEQPDFLLRMIDAAPSEASPIQSLNRALRETLLGRPAAAQAMIPEQSQGAPFPVEGELLHRMPKLVKRMRRVCLALMKESRLPHLVEGLDQFTGEVISSVTELQSLTVGPSAEKEKQRSEAKHILMQKQRALADLFKHLAKTGLSYRKGLAWARSKNPQEMLHLHPLDLWSALSIVSSTQEADSRLLTEISSSWDGCQKYFYRSLARHARLSAALATPAKEMGVGNIERCKGFSTHLMKVLIRQRRCLTTLTEQWILLRNLLSCVQEIHGRLTGPLVYPVAFPPQDAVQQWTERLQHLAMQSQILLEQLSWLLQCCPSAGPAVGQHDAQAQGQPSAPYPEGPELTQRQLSGVVLDHVPSDLSCPSPVPRNHLPSGCWMRKQDQLWQQSTARLTEMLKTVKTVKADIDKIRQQSCETLFHSWKDFEVCSSGVSCLSQVSAHLQGLESLFILPGMEVGQRDQQIALVKSLEYVRGEINKATDDFTTWKTHLLVAGSQGGNQMMDEGFVEDFSEQMETAIRTILYAIQNLAERNSKKTEENMHQTGPQEEDRAAGFERLQSGHLTKLLEDDFWADVSTLHVQKIISAVSELLERLKSYGEDGTAAKHTVFSQSCCLAVRLVPMLSRYSDVVLFFLTMSLATHHCTAKLLSVLAQVFTELAQKGFCLPKEFMEDSAGEGATEFHDYEGGGIGEGEGMKDVSDQIENEEQAEDTFQKGQEKDKEDADSKSDIKGEDNAIEMSEDFDGKMHDGELEEQEEEDDKSDSEGGDLDKQMGDLHGEEADKLDERLWGDDDEEEDEEEEDSKTEETGPGMDEEDCGLVAKDDNLDSGKSNRDKNQQDKKEKKEEPEADDDGQGQDKINEQIDEREYDENEVDPYHGNQETLPEPEALDLSDDLNLDSEDKNGDEDTDHEEGEEENPLDIKEKPMDANEAGHEAKEINEETEADHSEGQGQHEPEEGPSEEDRVAGEEEMDTGADDQDTDAAEPEENSEEEQQSLEDEDEEASEESAEKGIPADQGLQPQKQEKEEGETSDTDDQGPEAAERTEHDSCGQTGLESLQSTQALELAGAAPEKEPGKESFKRKPGQADNERSMGDHSEHVHKRLRTVDVDSHPERAPALPQAPVECADAFEHIKQGSGPYDAQTYDVASREQRQSAQDASEDQKEEETEDISVDTEEQKLLRAVDAEQLKPEDVRSGTTTSPGFDEMDMGTHTVETEEDQDPRTDKSHKETENEKPERSRDSSIHTAHQFLVDMIFQPFLKDICELRQELERQLEIWQPHESGNPEEEKAAAEMWQSYLALTAPLSQQLCEQLRLILEPTQAAKLKGDYRTGKRLNMRKVIPYIASQFRKDKIWLRRTKPSKRQYQICLAIDDSSSMVDNHTKQLAFESLAVIGNALTLLEVGQIAVCSFGESVKLLHPFHEQFGDYSGSQILQLCKFQQKKTKIAQFLESVANMFAAARQLSQNISPETAQLLLVVSDGRGLFLEGKDRVLAAVQAARNANIFVIFVVLDNPSSRDSILDIKVPIFKGPGEMPEIRSYMEEFPFPFYIILRDVNALPETLSDALRQWFELVTASDHP